MKSKRVKIIGLTGVIILAGGFFIMPFQPFGKLSLAAQQPDGGTSSHYRDGKFINLVETPMMTGTGGFAGALKDFLFPKNKRIKPEHSLPSMKTDLASLNPDDDVLVWLGHSSYFLQIDGKRILVDPVLSGRAFTVSSFDGTDPYTADDLPDIDYLFISHDHWDHLDYQTVMKLKPKVKKVITGLGVGSYFAYWGYDAAAIIEKDWYEEVVLDDGFSAVVTPSRHFSGRTLARNKTLWSSFVIKTPHSSVFISGDSGYGDHFSAIGKAYGPFDLAILECGQYDRGWSAIHMMPEETVQASIDLGAKKLFAGHWGKFALSLHNWDDPILRAEAECRKRNVFLLHPMIGEKADINAQTTYARWWETTGREGVAL